MTLNRSTLNMLNFQNALKRVILFQPISVHYSCMDARVLSSRFMQSDFGDNYIIKNAGNFVPHAKNFSYLMPVTEAGALELGCVKSGVKHVVVCGHSDCKVRAAEFVGRLS